MNDVLQFDPAIKEKRGPAELGHRLPGVVTPETIEELRDRKLITEQAETVDLDAVALGEQVVGYLNAEDRTLYIATVHLTADLEDMSREMTARSHEVLAGAIRKTPNGKNVLRNVDEKFLFPTKDDAEEYYGMLTRLEYLRALFNQSTRSRYGHSDILGVRANFAVVRVRSKYEIPSELIEQMGE